MWIPPFAIVGILVNGLIQFENKQGIHFSINEQEQCDLDIQTDKRWTMGLVLFHVKNIKSGESLILSPFQLSIPDYGLEWSSIEAIARFSEKANRHPQRPDGRRQRQNQSSGGLWPNRRQTQLRLRPHQQPDPQHRPADWDDLGNLIHRELADGEVQNYFYDLHDQLVKAEIFKKDGSKETWAYTYDALGRRIGKGRLKNEKVSDGLEEETGFVWDGSHLL